MLENRIMIHFQNGKQLKVSVLKLQQYNKCESEGYQKYLKYVKTVLSGKSP